MSDAKPFGRLQCQLWDKPDAACPRALLWDAEGDGGWAWLVEPPKKFGELARFFIGYRESRKRLVLDAWRPKGSIAGYVCNGRGAAAKNGNYGS